MFGTLRLLEVNVTPARVDALWVDVTSARDEARGPYQ